MPRVCKLCLSDNRDELEKALLDKRITQTEVAQMLGIAQSRISDHLKNHLRRKLAEVEAPLYIQESARSHLNKIESLRMLVKQLEARVILLCNEEISLQAETALRNTVSEYQKAIMNLAKLEGEITPEVEINIDVKVKEQVVALLKVLPADIQERAYKILKEKVSIER